MIVDPAGWLEENQSGHPPLERVPSVRRGELEVPAPLAVVWHWTGGRCATVGHAPALAEWIRTLDRAKEPNPQSWHVLVAKDGRVFQSVPFTAASWHVGKPGVVCGRKSGNINRCTIGIELQNSGRLLSSGGRLYCSPFWKNPEEPDARKRVVDPNLEIAAERMVQLRDGIFDDFPPAQVAAAERVARALAFRFSWGREAFGFGHSTFDSPRKEDPGPRWMSHHLPALLDRVFGPAQLS